MSKFRALGPWLMKYHQPQNVWMINYDHTRPILWLEWVQQTKKIQKAQDESQWIVSQRMLSALWRGFEIYTASRGSDSLIWPIGESNVWPSIAFFCIVAPGKSENCVFLVDVQCLIVFTDVRCMFDWWFGTFFIFPYIGNVIIPTDELIFFQRGRYTTNQMWMEQLSLETS